MRTLYRNTAHAQVWADVHYTSGETYRTSLTWDDRESRQCKLFHALFFCIAVHLFLGRLLFLLELGESLSTLHANALLTALAGVLDLLTTGLGLVTGMGGETDGSEHGIVRPQFQLECTLTTDSSKNQGTFPILRKSVKKSLCSKNSPKKCCSALLQNAV